MEVGEVTHKCGGFLSLSSLFFIKYVINNTEAKEFNKRNFCVNLLRKTKKDYFQNLNIRDLSDKSKSWKTIKPYFTNKGLTLNKLRKTVNHYNEQFL